MYKRDWYKAVLGGEIIAGLIPAKVTLPLQMELVVVRFHKRSLY